MPELPEVETVVRGLRPALEGRTIAGLALGPHRLRFPYPDRFMERLRGRKVRSVNRRAKYILASLEGGETLLWHLGMTGRFTVKPPHGPARNLGEFYDEASSEAAEAGTHEHVAFALDDGSRITYSDPRRFGFADLIGEAEMGSHKLLRDIGPEPLGNEFNAAHLAQAFHRKKAPLKAALLDQHVVAGLGNIYVSEILHRSGLRPSRLAGTLSGRRVNAGKLDLIVRHTRSVLEEAILAGGSTLQDFAHADGSAGAFQQRFRVYDREGEPCPTPACTGAIKRIVQSGRSSFYCPKCQK
jgi:formamidopyrimidine-DNA glycosylase